MSNVKDLRAIFGEVIFDYSRKQALEDGVLVDLNKFIPVRESGYKFNLTNKKDRLHSIL